MLLISTPLPPNKMDGRSTACETPRSARACSTAALPRKYGYGESASGWVMEVCTIRCTPASAAARNSARELATAVSWLIDPRANRTQYVLYRVVAPCSDDRNPAGSAKSSGLASIVVPAGARPG